ncbi:hypothetical protein [Arsukibacterium sp.]|uniref:hypothetical protein n=1 Tax=Arsukibacterium sp. TaxID=1977258 RepID=UPI00299E24B1|nr:hypothetical protein [Arsukibacterium sp.]MDX1538355.1 hypothetical protein [Arsukibacterium sp.]
MDRIRNIHWPSCFWFLVAIISAAAFVTEQKFSLLLQAVGFTCLGYASIRLVPGDFFTRKLSLSKLIQAKTEYRGFDVLIQSLGLLLLIISLVLGHVIS